MVFTDREAIALLPTASHEEFYRPPTGFNRLVAVAVSHLPRRDLSHADLRGWLASSLEVFSHFVPEPSVLDRIGRETTWIISDDEPPDPDVWSGECKFAGPQQPIVLCYNQTLASRLRGSLRELAWQGSMDHFVGHLYPLYAGAEDPNEYNEDVACRFQHLAAQFRGRSDRRFKIIAGLMPITYRLHKQIPLSNYARL